jgi:mono/diheme cytochrome c family protein
MSMRNARLVSVTALALLMGQAFAAESPHLGRVVTSDEIAVWDLDAMPDGRFLPAGSGTPEQGHAVYVEKCQSCHGPNGNDGTTLPLLGGVGTIGQNDVKPLRTIGSYWPYAPSIFAYIRRAMPYYDSKSLTNDEVYAVTAYLLRLNRLIGETDTMNAETLAKVEMPWRDHFRPFIRGD